MVILTWGSVGGGYHGRREAVKAGKKESIRIILGSVGDCKAEGGNVGGVRRLCLTKAGRVFQTWGITCWRQSSSVNFRERSDRED